MIIGGYLWYVAVNFQRLHNEFGRVGYVNLPDDNGNLTIVQGTWVRCEGALGRCQGAWGRCQGAWGICQGAWERCQGAWGRFQGGSRKADGCSIVHPYYYRNHDTWSQIYGKLWRAKDDQGSLVECTTTILIHFTDAAQIFICRIMVKVLNILKQLAHSKVHAGPCKMMQNASTEERDVFHMNIGDMPFLMQIDWCFL